MFKEKSNSEVRQYINSITDYDCMTSSSGNKVEFSSLKIRHLQAKGDFAKYNAKIDFQY
jgi:hypothetical protein